jgi:hypothetical protein
LVLVLLLSPVVEDEDEAILVLEDLKKGMELGIVLFVLTSGTEEARKANALVLVFVRAMNKKRIDVESRFLVILAERNNGMSQQYNAIQYNAIQYNTIQYNTGVVLRVGDSCSSLFFSS